MKKLFILFFFLLLVSFTVAKTIEFDNIETIAQNWYLENFNTAPVYQFYSTQYNGYTTFYTFNFSGGGYLIISSDDNVYPILAFSYDSFAPQNITDPAVQSYINGLNKTVYDIIQNNYQQTEFQKVWNKLLNNDFSEFIHTTKDVAPLVSTKWDQDYPYNMYCPMENGQRTLTGCVATAMGQIMKTNNYPEHGTGSHSYNWNGQTLSADFENTTYQWNLMPNHLYSTSPINQRQAVATLLYHCGVATDMDYGVDGSGTYTQLAESAFQLYFAYDPYSVTLRTRANYTDQEWIDYLKADLDDGFPILYAGDDGTMGHAFVCDGYQNNNSFHFNWGWSGYYDGYFYLNNLNPMGYNFNQHQQAIFGIRPPAAPQPPQNLTAMVLNTDVLLTWEAPSDKPHTGYRIYRDNELLVELTNPQNISYYDMQLPVGEHSYYITSVYSSPDAESEPSNTVTVQIGASSENSVISTNEDKIYEIYPNPLLSSSKINATIKYYALQNGKIDMAIFNLKGEKVCTLISEYNTKGNHSVIWNAKNNKGQQVSAGVYIIRMLSNNKLTDIKKLLIIK